MMSFPPPDVSESLPDDPLIVVGLVIEFETVTLSLPASALMRIFWTEAVVNCFVGDPLCATWMFDPEMEREIVSFPLVPVTVRSPPASEDESIRLDSKDSKYMVILSQNGPIHRYARQSGMELTQEHTELARCPI